MENKTSLKYFIGKSKQVFYYTIWVGRDER